MANSKPTDPLDQLQYLLNDVVLQIGKTLRASNKQTGRQSVAQIQQSINSRIPNAIENFHWALDDLENEIVRAKGALQRDLDREKEKKRVLPSAALSPMQTPTRSPQAAIAVDVVNIPPSPTSPPANTPNKAPGLPPPPSQETPAAPTAPMAPFPDMGVGSAPAPALAPALAPIPASGVKKEATPSAPQAMMEPTGGAPVSNSAEAPQATPAIRPPASKAPEAPMDGLMALGNGVGGGDAAPEGTNTGAEFNFTAMTFDLAPSSDDAAHPTAQAPNANMDSYGSTEDMMSLDDLLPVETTELSQPPAIGTPVSQAPATTATTVSATATTAPQTQPQTQPQPPPTAAAAPAPAATPAGAKDENGKKAAGQAEQSLDIFDLDVNNGMDLDMGLGNGPDDSNFDNMFFDDSNMDGVEFDDAFFGLSST